MGRNWQACEWCWDKGMGVVRKPRVLRVTVRGDGFYVVLTHCRGCDVENQIVTNDERYKITLEGQRGRFSYKHHPPTTKRGCAKFLVAAVCPAKVPR
jgi:hypothetical protein